MIYLVLICVSLGMGLAALAAFLWALHNGQFSDLDGAAWRVILQQRENQQEAQGLSDIAGVVRRPLAKKEWPRGSESKSL